METNIILGIFYVTNSPYLTSICIFAAFNPEDNIDTFVASNVSPPESSPHPIPLILPTQQQQRWCQWLSQIQGQHKFSSWNKRTRDCPLKAALADGRSVMSTHVCDVDIPGLPVTLTGHIIPELSIASLFGIRVLTNVGCTVTFDINKCVVNFNGNEILQGYKDDKMDLWTLPLGGDQRTPAQHDYVMPVVACPKMATARTWSPPAADSSTQVANFAHTVRAKANSIKFAHQSFCSPQLATFLKAI